MVRRSTRKRSASSNGITDETGTELQLSEREPKKTPKRKVEEEKSGDYLEISIPDPSIVEIAEETVASASVTRKAIKKTVPLFPKSLQMLMRQVHLFSFIISLQQRSFLCNNPLIQALLLSIIPNHISNHFGKDNHRTLINGLSMLANWWKNTFGLRLRGIPNIMEGAVPRFTFGYFKRIISEKQAYEDDLVQLFCSLCRALGLRTRFVGSWIFKKDYPVNGEEFSYLPDFWVEIYHKIENKWIPVDCTRAIVNCRKSMEMGSPGGNEGGSGRRRTKTSTKQHSFIIGIDNVGYVTDVTRRYSSKYYGATWKIRLSEEKHLLRYLELLNSRKILEILYDEECELESFTEAEPIPETAAGFNMHGKYVLEGKLKKYEVFHPSDDIVGTFKDENIHLRRSVKKVRSKEAWYTQFARSLVEGTEPVKVIQLPKKRKKGFVGPDEDPYEPGAMQPLYGEWQTIPYEPPKAINGKVPRNAHGNVDLFQPEMLPISCAYIPYNGAWRSAKELGVDYADACVRFAFHGRMAVPNLQGIVVCKEDEQRVLARHFAKIEESLQTENAEMARQEILKKRREALSVKISSRLQQEYGQESSETEEPRITSAFSKSQTNSDVEEFSFE